MRGSFKHRLLLGTLLIVWHAILHADDFNITVSDHIDLNLQRYPANGTYLLIWIAAGNGLDTREIQLTKQLAQRGIEVWQIDFADALFQPHGNQFLRELNPDYVADLISTAHQRTGKKIALAAHAYGAIPILNGIHRWQQQQPSAPYLIGAILFTPELYVGAPELGQYPEYVATTYATRTPLFIFQDGKHHTRWQLPRLLQTLQHQETPIYTKILRKVTGLFYSSDDSGITQASLRDIPTQIQQALPLLAATPISLQAAPLTQTYHPIARGLNSHLQPFKGNPVPPALDLYDISHHRLQRPRYTGKVTVVNFWATWCPPCVDEIPSLNRLRSLLRNEKFELISINYAEDSQRIHAFFASGQC